MNLIPIVGTRNRNASACGTRACNGFSLFLLSLAAIELLTWPLTQNLWNWDHFLRGGQDFETCLLVAVISLCLMLLLAQHCKHHMDQLLRIHRLFRFRSDDRESASLVLGRSLSILLLEPITSRSLSLYSPPLQI